jgi:TonB family protein
MKTKEAASLFVVPLLAVILCAPVANDGAPLDLQSDYVNKVLRLRRFYKGDHLSFAADGTLVGIARIGPWTLDGQILVQDIEFIGQNLDIQGRRLSLVFDKKNKPSRDVIEFMDDSIANVEERKKIEEDFLNRNVEIEIKLGSGEMQDSDIKSAMDAVFVTPEESMADLVPEYWREYFERQEGRPITVGRTTPTPYLVMPGVVSAPHALYTPEPEFSEDARRAKYQGTVTLSLIVDTTGKVVDVRITTPLGMGLDEKAVEAIRKWKFEPAKIGDDAVPVQIAVEIDFHLY